MKSEPINADAMEAAVSIEKDIPSRITGENRVFIRAVIARAITAAVAAEREACAEVAKSRWKQWGHLKQDQLWKVDVASCDDIASAIRARDTP